MRNLINAVLKSISQVIFIENSYFGIAIIIAIGTINIQTAIAVLIINSLNYLFNIKFLNDDDLTNNGIGQFNTTVGVLLVYFLIGNPNLFSLVIIGIIFILVNLLCIKLFKKISVPFLSVPSVLMINIVALINNYLPNFLSYSNNINIKRDIVFDNSIINFIYSGALSIGDVYLVTNIILFIVIFMGAFILDKKYISLMILSYILPSILIYPNQAIGGFTTFHLQLVFLLLYKNGMKLKIKTLPLLIIATLLNFGIDKLSYLILPNYLFVVSIPFVITSWILLRTKIFNILNK